MSSNPRLENWKQIDNFVAGTIYNDMRFEDGDIVFTSRVRNIDREKSILQTKNTVYDLGEEIKG